MGLLIPGFAVAVRRLHDIDRSGWWVLLNAGSYVFIFAAAMNSDPKFIVNLLSGANPVVMLALMVVWLAAAVILLIFVVTGGTEGPNRFGPDPYGRDSLEQVFA
jgi:uncharacterized membrane protein YhaH (DUF805 family)